MANIPKFIFAAANTALLSRTLCATWTEHVLSAFSVKYYFFDLCCIPNSYQWTTLKTQNVEHFACTVRFLHATVLNFVLSGFENKIVEVGQQYC